MTAPADPVRVQRALISVADKTDVQRLARGLARLGVELVSTGSTAKLLRAEGLAVRDVSAVTGFPEVMDGRVKTLHPKIHGAVLARRDNASDQAVLRDHEIDAIDLVVINLYPFERAVASGADFNDCIEQIDIGGPALIRAAAKNHAFVAVVTDVGDYDELLATLGSHHGMTTADFRRGLAAKAFAHSAAYDGAIARWFAAQSGELPATWVAAGRLRQRLRYGENPHQSAALYVSALPQPGVAHGAQIQGKELSYNNLWDAEAAWTLAQEFDRPAVAIIKHANPCGVAIAEDLATAHRAAIAGDPVSAFGGIVAVNRALDADTAAAITAVFTEVVVASDADNAARKILARKANLRVLLTGNEEPKAPGKPAMSVRALTGGLLVQESDSASVTAEDLTVVTQRAPSAAELADLLFAFAVCKHVTSNAIVYAKHGATVGIGAGQMSRVDSVRIAAWKAEEAARQAGEGTPRTRGSVVASDAFFPFADGLLAAVEAGATAVIQPGGSKRDQEIIDAANEAGIAMVFTGVRHFRH